MSPVEALHQVIAHQAFFSDSKRRFPKPGQIVGMQCPEVREALSRLTSHQASKARNDYIQALAGESTWVYQQTTGRLDQSLVEQRRANGLTSRLKMAFDRKRRPAWAARLG